MQRDSIRSYRKFSIYKRFLVIVTCLMAVGFVCLPAVAAQQAGNQSTLTYIKVMKGSVPEYTLISVNSDGVGTYQGRRLDQSPNPRPLKLTPGTTQELFRLAASLGDFHSIRLESKAHVANMGEKTFIYRHDGQENKVQFNYTRNKRATELLSLFEGISDVEQHISRLEYSSRYDLLSLPSALTQVEIDLNNKMLVDPQLMVPILKKIVAGNQYMHIAQARAENILQRIQDPGVPHRTARHFF